MFLVVCSSEVVCSLKLRMYLTFLCLALLEENLGCPPPDVLSVLICSPIQNSVVLSKNATGSRISANWWDTRNGKPFMGGEISLYGF